MNYINGSYISNIEVFNCDLADLRIFTILPQLTLIYKRTFSFCNWLEYYILFNTAIECICISSVEN